MWGDEGKNAALTWGSLLFPVMAVLGDKVYNYCLPFGEPPQKLLITILIVLGLLALLEYTIKLVTLVSRLKRMSTCTACRAGLCVKPAGAEEGQCRRGGGSGRGREFLGRRWGGQWAGWLALMPAQERGELQICALALGRL